jgi:hypothetical protein
MRIGLVALACAALTALSAGCHSTSDRSGRSNAAAPVAAAAPQPRLPAEAAKGRIVLSREQVDQGLKSGTLDRPVQSLLAVNGPMQFGDYLWNDKAIPSGPTWMRVDLGKQLISVFRGPHEIGTAVIVYGGDNKQTPAGKFHILMRDRDHRSSLYDAAMPYTLQLTGDGVSIHGSTVRWGAATHGCIGVPLEFARRLFDQAKVGDEVVIVPPPKAATATA